MRINEGILDDIEAKSVDVNKVFQPDNMLWPGDKTFSVYITLEFVGTLEASALKELCDSLLMFLEIQRKIDIYSRMCATDVNYRLIRDFDAAIAQNKKFRNYGIDFGIAHHFTRAIDVVRFYVKLFAFCGKKLRIMKVRANYGKEHSIEIDKTFTGFINKIFFKDWKTNATVTAEMMQNVLSLVNINIPDNDAVVLEVINAFKPSYDIFSQKIRGRLYRESQLCPSFNLEDKNNYITLPETLYDKMLSEHISWEQFRVFGESRGDIDDIIAVTNGGAEISDNRAAAAEVLSERPVKIHDLVFRFNEDKNVVFMCVVLNPFGVDTHKWRPNFELAIFTYTMYRESHYLNMLKVLWPWMKEKDYQTIWKSIPE